MKILKKFETDIGIRFEISEDKKQLDIISEEVEDEDYIMPISKKELKEFMNELQEIYYEMRE